MRRIVLALAAAAVFLVTASTAPPAQAGGANLQPVQDRYEAGETATYVGYVGPSSVAGWVQDEPYYAYAETGTHEKVLLGRLMLEPSSLGPQMLRVSVSFTVPELASGRYPLSFCDDPCTKGLGDLAGGTLDLGADPAGAVSREWPPDEPEIANLPPGAAVSRPPVGLPPAGNQGTETAAPAPAPAPVPAPAVPVPAATTAAARPVASHGPDASPAALAVGGALAAICTGMVLVALRDG